MAASAAFIDMHHFDTAELIARALARIKRIEPMMGTGV
jgi:hypothetical protein